MMVLNVKTFHSLIPLIFRMNLVLKSEHIKLKRIWVKQERQQICTIWRILSLRDGCFVN